MFTICYDRPAFELGLCSFAALTPDSRIGARISPAARLSNLLETVELAEQVGLDVFALGEHHRPEFISSAPAVILAAAAARTRRIRLSSAVTVLSSDNPVRVFQDFATLDLIAEGRVEIVAGRGSFIESSLLFGHDRLLCQLGVGSVPHDRMMHAIELLGTQVAPVVKTEIARRRRAVG